MPDVDLLVLGTVNAPWKRSLDARTLAHALVLAAVEEWLPHMAVLFLEVRPSLVLAFAEAHHIAPADLFRAYERVKDAAGEANPILEDALADVAKAA